MLHRDIFLLKPSFREQVKKFLAKLDEAGIKYFINETLRDQATQKVYYMQGRQPLIEVNAARRAIGLWELTEEENKKPVTWTHVSRHIVGLAIDIAPMKDGKPNWNAPDSEWKAIADISVESGLRAGYYFKGTKDCPHHEQA